jgi:hypothetical protein
MKHLYLYLLMEKKFWVKREMRACWMQHYEEMPSVMLMGMRAQGPIASSHVPLLPAASSLWWS